MANYDRLHPRHRTPSGHDMPIPESVFHALRDVQIEVHKLAQSVAVDREDTKQEIATMAKAIADLSATWKDKAVAQFGAIALAVIAVIGGQRALAPTPEPAKTVIYKSELQTQADICLKRANGSDPLYVQCMAQNVVAPNAPGSQGAR